MRKNEQAKQFFAFSLDILKHKKGITVLNITCNAVIFSYQAAVTFCIRQILNIIESAQGFSFGAVIPYFMYIAVFLSLARIAAIMGCACLDTLRGYYYRNRIGINIQRLLLRKDNIAAVAGKSGAVFEVLDHDIPVSTFPAELLTEVTGHCVYTLIALSMLLLVDWQLTLFIFIPLSAAIFIIDRLSGRMKENRKNSRIAHDEASSFTGDIANTALAIKALGAEEAVLDNYDRINAKRRSALLRDTALNAKINALLNVSVCLGTALIMFAAARLMTGGKFGLGDFSLFAAHLGTLADCVNRIVELVAESRKAEVSYERMLNLAGNGNAMALNAGPGVTLKMKHNSGEEKAEIPQKSLPPFYTFEAKNLSFDYGDGKGFTDVSFTVKAGELAVIAGNLGSGKSTLLSVLMGLLPADSGEILINGKPVRANENGRLLIAGAPQRSGFFSSGLRENLCLGFPATEDDMKKALSVAALGEVTSAMPKSLDLDLGSQGEKFSGGQRQRLALARVFLRNAAIGIVDDCISALDYDTRGELLAQIREHLRLTSGALIMATNESMFLEAANLVLYMEQGRLYREKAI